MLAGGYSWRLFFYVEFAFGCALFILAFFVVEETLYHRKPKEDLSHESASSHHGEKISMSNVVSTASDHADVPPRKTFVQTLKFWGVYDRETNFFLMMARSFTYFLVPHVLWVVTTYGPSPFPSLLPSTPDYYIQCNH